MPSEAFRRYQAMRNKLADKGEWDLINDLDYVWQGANQVIINLEEALNKAAKTIGKEAGA